MGLAEQSFRADGLSRDSTLTVLVLGDASTANEPWQLGRYAVPVTSKVLEGKTADEKNFHAAAEAALKGAKPLRDNGFKVELAKRALVRSLTVATQTA